MSNEVGLFQVRRSVIVDLDVDALVRKAAKEKMISYSACVNLALRKVFALTHRTLTEEEEVEIQNKMQDNHIARLKRRAEKAKTRLEQAQNMVAEAEGAKNGNDAKADI